MDKRYYSAESLDRAMRELESEYGMTSESFAARYAAGETIEGVPYFTQHVWASFYDDVLRLTAGAGIERTAIMTRVGRVLSCA